MPTVRGVCPKKSASFSLPCNVRPAAPICTSGAPWIGKKLGIVLVTIVLLIKGADEAKKSKLEQE